MINTQTSRSQDKIALIYPPTVKRYSAIRDLGLAPPLHLLALASVTNGDVRIFNGAHDNLETMVHELQDFKPQVIGMNVDLTNYDNAIEIANNTDARIILGGNYAAFLAEQILKNQPRIEAICFNDGEEAFQEFVNGNLNASNLIHRGGRNPQKLPDITNNLTPAYELVDMNKYFKKQQEVFGPGFRMMQFYGQKGCLNKPHCSFCGRYEDGMRLRDPQKYCEEVMKYTKKYNLTEVWDRSDSFSQNKKWFRQVHSLLKGLGPTFKTYARADQLDDENIRMMQDLNFRMVYIGYEAGDDSLLTEMHKKETTGQYLDATKRVLDAGIDIDASFIVGLPKENKKTLENQVEFVEKLSRLGLRKIKINRVLVLPGTELYNRVCNAYPDVRKLDSFDNSDMQYKLYSTYDLTDFGNVDNFIAEIDRAAGVMADTILAQGGCAEGYGYNHGKKIAGGKEI
jgi:anaerobic magnesium-protoporphyrin IX monomethyl ester cyclase